MPRQCTTVFVAVAPGVVVVAAVLVHFLVAAVVLPVVVAVFVAYCLQIN